MCEVSHVSIRMSRLDQCGAGVPDSSELGEKSRGWVVVTAGGGRRLLSACGGGGVGIALQWRAGKVWWWICAISSAGWVTAARVRPVKRAVELGT